MLTTARLLRRGLTLSEVLVVLIVLGLAGASVGRLGVDQQSHYRDFAGRVLARSRLREGSILLAAELRGISPRAGDLYPGEMQAASLAFRSTVGSYALCEAAAAGSAVIDIIQPVSASDSSGFGDPPSAGDSLWLYDSGLDTGGADDRWLPLAIDGVSPVARSCASDASSATRDAFRVSLAAPVQGTTEPHAPVRVFRRVRYALYASSDGLWYLGYSDCRPIVRTPPCAPLQPISGPYEPYRASSAARSGLSFSYLDRDGIPTDDPFAVASIGIVLRARADDAGRFAWDAVERQSVVLRNAPR